MGPDMNGMNGMTANIADDLLPLAMEIGLLTPDPENVRVHDDASIAVQMASLRDFGQLKSVVIDADGVVLAGNGLLEAAKRLGWTHLAASEFLGDETLKRAYKIADNRAAELSEWDTSALVERLKQIDDPTTLADLGFSDDVVADIAATVQQTLDLADEAADLAAELAAAGGEAEDEEADVIGMYVMVFDTEADAYVWQGFLRLLKTQYPEFDTADERIIAHLRERKHYLTD